MKREDYLAELRLKLEENSFGQVEEAIAYFNELLEDRMADEGMDEEAAVASLEAPADVAAQLRENEGQAREAPEQSRREEVTSGVRSINVKADQVRFIQVRDRNTRLSVIGEKREDILIRHPENRKVRYDFTLQDGRLSLLREEVRLPFQFFVWDIDLLPREMREVEIRVPEELAAELDLRTSNSRLTLENVSCWGKVEAATSNARLSAVAVSAKSLKLRASNAGLSLQRVSARQALLAATSNGKITAEGVSAPVLDLRTSNSGITVAEITSDDITLTATNGAIRGELPGRMADYAIASGTSNGRNSLPPMSTGGAKRLSAHTSNAAISLKFLDGGAPEPQAALDHEGRPQTPAQDFERKIELAAEKMERRLSGLGDFIAREVESRLARAAGTDEARADEKDEAAGSSGSGKDGARD